MNRGPRPKAPRRGDSDTIPPRTHKSNACTACKQRKLRCRGGQPCEYCAANGLACQIDELTDMRRHDAVKRKVDRLENSEETLDRLLLMLKQSDRPHIEELLRVIRDGAGVDEIHAFLDDRFTPLERESPDLAELHSTVVKMARQQQSGRGGVMDVRRLADIPNVRVPAKPWTSVTDDDDLVSHLVSLWLTWAQPGYNWLDKEVFVRDMKAGNVDCRFCSPFLVNVILAVACYYSDYAEVYTIPGDAMSRGQHFADEARRLLDEDESQPSIPTIQGLAYLFIQLAMTGKGRVGFMHLKMAISAAEEYAVSHPESVENISEENAINHALWGLYNTAAMTSISLMKHVEMKPPRRPHPLETHDSPHDTWSPYPRITDPVPGHLNCTFARWSELCAIITGASQVLFNPEDTTPRSQIPDIIQRTHHELERWMGKMPGCLDMESAAVPHILYIHLFYNTTILQILGLLPFLEVDVPESVLSHAKSTCLSLARKNTSIITLHAHRFGIARSTPSLPHWISVSLFTLLEDLEDPENATSFTELCLVGRDLAPRYPFALGIMRMVQLSAAKMDAPLPERARQLFADFERDVWAKVDPGQFSSLYPNFGSAVRRRVSEVEMDRFLEKWDRLSLQNT